RKRSDHKPTGHTRRRPRLPRPRSGGTASRSAGPRTRRRSARDGAASRRRAPDPGWAPPDGTLATMPRSLTADARVAVLAWYDDHGRSLAFRASRDPYAILVSEVMAQ